MGATRRLAQAAMLCLALLAQGCDGDGDGDGDDKITAQEKDLLITAAEVAPYMRSSYDLARGEFKKAVNPVIDSKELTYHFQFKEGSDEAPLFIHYVVKMEPKIIAVYDNALQDAGFDIGFAIGKLKQVPLDGFPTYGDRSSIKLLTMDERPVGNIFSVQYGRKTARLIITGMYIRNPAVWQEMIGGKLKLLESYAGQAKD